MKFDWVQAWGEPCRFQSFDGEWLRYYRVGKGPPVLLVNGFVCTTNYWIDTVEALRKNYTVLCWDYRGHGENAPPVEIETIDFPSFAHDMEALLCDAEVDKAVLIGHSMGVQVCLEFFRRYRRLVRGLVLLCGSFESPAASFIGLEHSRRVLGEIADFLKPYDGLVAWAFKPILRSQLAVTLAYRFGAERDLVPRAELVRLFGHVTRMDFSVSIRCFFAMVNHSARDLLPAIEVPTLLVCGAKDALAPPSSTKVMQEAMPHASSQVYAEGSHLAMIECKERWLRDLQGFLAGFP